MTHRTVRNFVFISLVSSRSSCIYFTTDHLSQSFSAAYTSAVFLVFSVAPPLVLGTCLVLMWAKCPVWVARLPISCRGSRSHPRLRGRRHRRLVHFHESRQQKHFLQARTCRSWTSGSGPVRPAPLSPRR